MFVVRNNCYYLNNDCHIVECGPVSNTTLAAKVFPLSKATEAKRDTRREDLQCVHSIPLGEPPRHVGGWVWFF